MAPILIAFGANLGDPESTLERVVAALNQHPEVEVQKTSRARQTVPVGGDVDQPAYTNAAMLLQSTLDPNELFRVLQNIEQNLGRTREDEPRRWMARSVDLDILLFGQRVISELALSIPHPRMSFRRFVLEPACEIAAELIHPVAGVSLGELLQKIEKKIFLILLAVAPGFDREELANKVESKKQKTNLQFLTRAKAEQTFTAGLDPVEFDSLERFSLCFVDNEQDYLGLEDSAQLVVVIDHPQRDHWYDATQPFQGSVMRIQLEPGEFKTEDRTEHHFLSRGADAIADEMIAACRAMLPTSPQSLGKNALENES